ncbi:hypothetical protein QQS21_011100 [Conoideocrella luteorostrata]|uniref:Protein kinase domain-containing protein n=1 Tax=Conoideocrella luteorostrata TaxID=1105319 RepID=A0AAJ0CDR4_9HYPO|nr:hypothetical protein QQS21_011100 [Conoideocrella luteorostrata]
MLEKTPKTPLYDIQGWDIGDNDFDMSVRLNGVLFTITASLNNLINSPHALQAFREIFMKISLGKDDCPEVWNYSESIVNVFLPDMEQLSPPIVHTGKLTLADLRPRGTFECEYRVIDEKPVPSTITPRTFEDIPDDESDIRLIQSRQLIRSNFPIFDPVDIEVPYSEGEPIYNIIPRRVYVQNKSYFYKPCWSPYDAIDELEKYAIIATSGKSLHTSRLFGIIADAHGHPKGLLYDWIEMRDAGVLTYVLKPDTPSSLREKWATQIQRTVTELHRLGVIWGDVKPDNVLIDINDNAIVIDLEGGTTRGWVDHDIGGSLEGDLQGLGKLINFVLKDEWPPGCSRMSDEVMTDESS